MQSVLIRAICFVLIILLGYLLRRGNVFGPETFSVLSKVVMKVTLPAVIIHTFAEKEIDIGMLLMILLGFGFSVLCMVVGYAINLHRDRDAKIFGLVNLSGCNIGSFTMPFVQTFLGPIGVITVGLFDVGNALLSLGGIFCVASMLKDGKRISLKQFFGTIIKSIPLLCYLIMVPVAMCRISLPAPLIELAEIIGGANTCVVMLMIGVGFKIEANKEQLRKVTGLLLWRYGLALVCACAAYTLLPLDLKIRQALVIALFSPITLTAPPFTGELEGDVGLSSAANSISILISLVIISSLLTVML